jgi:NitT/TauT family transport system substrate-binding protein
MSQMGYLDDIDVSVEVKTYGEGDRNLSNDFREGTVEVALANLHWAIFQHGRGEPSRVTAANNKNGFVFLGSEELAGLWADHGPDALEVYRELNEEQVTLLSGPNLDALLTDIWLDSLDISGDAFGHITSNTDSETVKPLISKNSIDGVFTNPPTPAVLARTDLPLKELSWIPNVVPNQPGGVTVMKDEFWRDNPEDAKAILEKHVEATEVLNERPGEVADIVGNALGVSSDLASEILRAKTANFITDPRQITEGAKPVVEMMVKRGYVKETVSLDAVFEPSLYTAVA